MRALASFFFLLSIVWAMPRAEAAADGAGAALSKKVDEKKGPAARYQGYHLDDIELDAKADQKRDEQIDQLKKIIPKVQGPQKADLLFRLAELWWEKSKFVAHKGIGQYDAAMAQWLAKTSKGEAAGPEPRFESFLREGELYRQEVLRKYEEILREFPTYERKDEVLFAFAYNKYEIGQKDEAIDKYNELIKQYPTSRFVPDTYVQMGEHFFNTNQLLKARSAFEHALSTNNSKIKYFALYKLAWCDFNGAAYEEAIKKFKEVIANAKVEKGGTGLKTEALNDIVLSFAQLETSEEAVEFLKQNTGEENARRLIAKLAAQYQEAGRHESAIRTYRTLIAEGPMDPRCPEYQSGIVVSYEGLRKRDQVAGEMRRLVELYRPASDWAKANAANKAAIETAYEITENAMRTIVVEYHQEAQKTKVVETYRLARDLYKEYLDNFAESESAYNLRYYYADILWALNELGAAATQYGRVVDQDPRGQYSKMAAYNTVLSYEKLVDVEKGKLKLAELKEDQHIDEKKAKGKLEKTTVKLERHQSDATAEEIPKWEGKLVEAIDKYVMAFPGNEDEISVRYKAAFVFYDHKHDVEAAKRFGEIINRWPTDQWSRKAADLTLDILDKKEEWLELNRLAREFNKNEKLVAGDREFAARIEDLVEASQYKYIDETIYKAQKKPAEAALKFRELADEFPRSKYSPQALLYAMLIHGDAGELDLGIADGERILRDYSDGKTLDGTPLAPRAILNLASFHEKIADFKAAASYYERYVETKLGKTPAGGKEKKAELNRKAEMKKLEEGRGRELSAEESQIAAALINAALWSEGLSNFAHAIELYMRYIELFPGQKEAPAFYFNVGLIYEKQKDYKEAARIYRSYVELYAKDLPAAKAFYAKYREMLALRELKQEREAQQKIEELVKVYEKLPPEARETEQSLDAYAHARFLALEALWSQYTSIKFDNVGKLKKSLKEKLQAIQNVEKAYAAVLALGVADWGIAALTRIGLAYQDFARNLMESPDPKGLDEDQLGIYRSELEMRAFPLEERAAEAFEKAIAKSAELNVYNEWVLKAQDQVNQLKPGSFLEAREVPLQGAELFATAPAEEARP